MAHETSPDLNQPALQPNGEDTNPVVSSDVAINTAEETGVASDANQPDVADRSEQSKVEAAIAAVKSSHDADDVDLYLRTLAALDSDTWAVIDEILPPIR